MKRVKVDVEVSGVDPDFPSQSKPMERTISATMRVYPEHDTAPKAMNVGLREAVLALRRMATQIEEKLDVIPPVGGFTSIDRAHTRSVPLVPREGIRIMPGDKAKFTELPIEQKEPWTNLPTRLGSLWAIQKDQALYGFASIRKGADGIYHRVDPPLVTKLDNDEEPIPSNEQIVESRSPDDTLRCYFESLFSRWGLAPSTEDIDKVVERVKNIHLAPANSEDSAPLSEKSNPPSNEPKDQVTCALEAIYEAVKIIDGHYENFTVWPGSDHDAGRAVRFASWLLRMADSRGTK